MANAAGWRVQEFVLTFCQLASTYDQGHQDRFLNINGGFWCLSAACDLGGKCYLGPSCTTYFALHVCLKPRHTKVGNFSNVNIATKCSQGLTARRIWSNRSFIFMFVQSVSGLSSPSPSGATQSVPRACGNTRPRAPTENTLNPYSVYHHGFGPLET